MCTCKLQLKIIMHLHNYTSGRITIWREKKGRVGEGRKAREMEGKVALVCLGGKGRKRKRD